MMRTNQSDDTRSILLNFIKVLITPLVIIPFAVVGLVVGATFGWPIYIFLLFLAASLSGSNHMDITGGAIYPAPYTHHILWYNTITLQDVVISVSAFFAICCALIAIMYAIHYVAQAEEKTMPLIVLWSALSCAGMLSLSFLASHFMMIYYPSVVITWSTLLWVSPIFGIAIMLSLYFEMDKRCLAVALPLVFAWLVPIYDHGCFLVGNILPDMTVGWLLAGLLFVAVFGCTWQYSDLLQSFFAGKPFQPERPAAGGSGVSNTRNESLLPLHKPREQTSVRPLPSGVVVGRPVKTVMGRLIQATGAPSIAVGEPVLTR